MQHKKAIDAVAKPFLKWAGGKRQLLQQFANLYPSQLKEGKIKKYYEPFLGSGAVFFDIAQHFQFESALLCDTNAALITTYQVIQAETSTLIELLYEHQKKYWALDDTGRQAYFYEQRAAFNTQLNEPARANSKDKRMLQSAQLIFLNRTCYNGLYRVNAKGWFNTPAGTYAKPVICDEDNLQAVAHLLKNATIRNADFATVSVKPDTSFFVYFDPPYRPLSATSSFTAYSKHTFTDNQQLLLAKIYRAYDKKGALLMLSNSDTGDNFFDDLYKGFTINRVAARRLINANASKRGCINEIVVTNYAL